MSIVKSERKTASQSMDAEFAAAKIITGGMRLNMKTLNANQRTDYRPGRMRQRFGIVFASALMNPGWHIGFANSSEGDVLV